MTGITSITVYGIVKRTKGMTEAQAIIIFKLGLTRTLLIGALHTYYKLGRVAVGACDSDVYHMTAAYSTL